MQPTYFTEKPSNNLKQRVVQKGLVCAGMKIYFIIQKKKKKERGKYYLTNIYFVFSCLTRCRETSKATKIENYEEERSHGN